MPEYRISFKLYENGLTRDLQMDYGDFVIRGQARQPRRVRARRQVALQPLRRGQLGRLRG